MFHLDGSHRSYLNFLRNGINGERGNMAPTNAMHTIHAPVPGMAEHGWHRKLGYIFSTLTDETALYRCVTYYHIVRSVLPQLRTAGEGL